MSLEDRLALLNPSCFTDSNQQHLLQETEPEGRVALLLQVSQRCLVLHNAKKNKMIFLKNQQVADFMIIELNHDKAVAIHIFELKKTISSSSWKKIQQQFEGAFYNTLGILGVLDLDVPEKVCFYSAFDKNKLATAPILRKVKSEGSIPENARMVNDWDQKTITIAWITNAPHKKIQWSWETIEQHQYALDQSSLDHP